MTDVLQTIIDAIALGSVYALVAMGIGLVFGVMRLVNFAHGELITFGAYALVLTNHLPLAVGLLVCFATVIGLSLAMEVAYRPLRTSPPTTMLVTTFAVSFLLQAVALLAFGARGQNANVLEKLNTAVSIGDVRVRRVGGGDLQRQHRPRPQWRLHHGEDPLDDDHERDRRRGHHEQRDPSFPGVQSPLELIEVRGQLRRRRALVGIVGDAAHDQRIESPRDARVQRPGRPQSCSPMWPGDPGETRRRLMQDETRREYIGGWVMLGAFPQLGCDVRRGARDSVGVREARIERAVRLGEPEVEELQLG